MIGPVQELDMGAGRVVRVGVYRLDSGDGTEPQRRVFVSAGWKSTPPTPFAAETVDIPLDALPELVEALEALEGEA